MTGRMTLVGAACCAVLTMSACKKDEAGGGGAAGEAAGDDKAAAKDAPKMSAAELMADLPTLKGMDAMTKFRDGVELSGKVLRTGQEMDESTFVHLDAGDGKWVAMTFTDQGADAKSRGLAAGVDVAALCKVGGYVDNYVMVIDCELH